MLTTVRMYEMVQLLGNDSTSDSFHYHHGFGCCFSLFAASVKRRCSKAFFMKDYGNDAGEGRSGWDDALRLK